MQKIKKEYLFLQVGNDKNRYVSKYELCSEASKYLSKNIYMCDLHEAIENIKEKCKKAIVFIVRKFLRLWRCNKAF